MTRTARSTSTRSQASSARRSATASGRSWARQRRSRWPISVIARGEHCSVYDTNGKKYFDALSGLFCTQIGYSFGAELGQAAAEQMADLGDRPRRALLGL